MIKIAPSILSSDFSKLGEEIEMLDRSGADIIHIDVMDGHFVPNITLGPLIVKAIRNRTKLPFDVHLMIDNPMDFADAYIDAGADIITIHQEVLPHLNRGVDQIKKRGVKASVSLNPSTSLHTLEYILEDLDMVLIMTVNPGFGGQSFISTMLDKISRLKDMIDSKGLNIDIQVDGGITPSNISEVAAAGANIFVAGSAVFNAPDPKDMIDRLRQGALGC